MCGIVGYVGSREGSPIVLSGLKRLEYRGYDSAGLASLEIKQNSRTKISIKRCEGKLENLIRSLEQEPLCGTSSIGHTRWATHGRPSEKNAHPHRFEDVVIVHNGIIENYSSLKEELKRRGHTFSSDTDSEVVAHLLQRLIDETQDFEVACQKLVNRLKGAFALAAMWSPSPHKIFVAKQDCPMVLGLGKDEQFLASDIPALLEYTRDFIFLDDGEMAFIEPARVTIKTFGGLEVAKTPKHVSWNVSVAEKEGFDHFMLKEISEQPRVLRDTLLGRIDPTFKEVQFDSVKWTPKAWKETRGVSIMACGTAWHAGLVGKYWIEKFARLHVDVDLASEFRYRDPVVDPKTLCVAISQSGETADTLAAIGETLKKKLPALSITNTVESSLARKTKNVIYTHAGPEIAVASTKCFVAQLGVLALLAIHLAKVRQSQSDTWITKTLKELAEIPEKISQVLKLNDQIRDVAKRYSSYQQYFYLGRDISYPMALEGALKLKEIAYINTQAYPAGEMKHGPIALISEDWPIVCLAPEGPTQEKMISNIQEVKARGGKILCIGTEGHSALNEISDEWIAIPKVKSEFSPFLTSVVLQLFAYHMSVLRGCDVDKPKNLAKSVTVE